MEDLSGSTTKNCKNICSALGFDRLVALFGGQDSIRDFIAFPKNNAGRDVMIDSPSPISKEQLKELNLIVDIEDKEKA